MMGCRVDRSRRPVFGPRAVFGVYSGSLIPPEPPRRFQGRLPAFRPHSGTARSRPRMHGWSLPHAADAWYRPDSVKIGYEIRPRAGERPRCHPPPVAGSARCRAGPCPARIPPRWACRRWWPRRGRAVVSLLRGEVGATGCSAPASSYVRPKTVSVIQRLKLSLPMNCLKSSVSSFNTDVITRANAWSCSMRAFCLSEFCLAFL